MGLLTPALLLIIAGIVLSLSGKSAVTIPDSPPIIGMSVPYTMRGEIYKMAIYEDGTVIYVEDKGLRFPLPGSPATRIWRTGQIQSEELNSLIGFFRSSHFDELEASYSYSEIPHSDMDCTIFIDYQDLTKEVRAQAYLSDDGDITYPDMPYPLNEIYRRLKDIATNRTTEVARESIS